MKLLWFNVTILMVVLLTLLINDYSKLIRYEFYKCSSVRMSKKSMCVEYIYDELSLYAELPRNFFIKAKDIQDYGLYYDSTGRPQLMRLRRNTPVQSVAFGVIVTLMIGSYIDIFVLYGLQLFGIILFIVDTFLDMRKDCVRNFTLMSEEDSSLQSNMFQMLFYNSVFKQPLYIVMHILAATSLIIGFRLLYCNSNINYEFYRICSELPYTLYPIPIKNLVLMFTDDNSKLAQLVVMTLPVYLYNIIVMLYIRRLFPWDMIWYNKYKSKYLNLRVHDNSLQE